MNQSCYYRLSVKALVTDANKNFLLARESNGTWDMLGGGLDHDEDPIVALRREIQEEAGLEVASINPLPKYFVTAHKTEKDIYIANVIYEVKIKNLQFTPSEECEELRYFTAEEAKKVALLPNVEKLLDALDIVGL